MKWNIVEKDGNPKKAGDYLTILLFDEWIQGEKTGNKVAAISDRFYVDLRECHDQMVWKMQDQSDDDFAWCEECGSIEGEVVYAWAEKKDIVEGLELPEGLEWEWNDN